MVIKEGKRKKTKGDGGKNEIQTGTRLEKITFPLAMLLLKGKGKMVDERATGGERGLKKNRHV